MGTRLRGFLNPGVSDESQLARGRETSAVPAGFRDVRLGAEREPDIARRSTAGQSLVGGASVLGQDKIASQNATVTVTELVAQSLTKFTETHDRGLFRGRASQI